MDRHQEESTTSQLGWHPEDTPILYRQTQKILIKKRRRYIQEGGLGQNPRQKQKKKHEKNNYGNLKLGKS
jgi:hypothetical protein